jgi:cytochrome c oxidase assembly protein subunit 15
MFLYPWSKMIGGIFYEHSHRLVASSVGLITIVLAWTFWFREKRQWLRWLGVGALALVVTQGILGGLRVVLLQHTLAIIHACFAQAFFALAVSLALFTSTEWRAPVAQQPIMDQGRLRRLAAMTTALIYLQVVFGAVLRHTGERVDAHLAIAALVAIHVILLFVRIKRAHRDHAKLARPANFLSLLLLFQLTLGAAAYFSKFTAVLEWPLSVIVWVTTTHLITGSLMLVTSLVITLRAYRLTSKTSAGLQGRVLAEQYSV